MEHLLSFSFVMPPTVFIVVCLAGALIALRWRRTGIAVALAGSLALYIASLPAVAMALVESLEDQIPLVVDVRGAQAIVVLGGDVEIGNEGGTPDTVGPMTLERLARAATLYRETQLPIAVSGGRVGAAHAPLGTLMQQVLEQDFTVPVRWNEDRSATTWENAVFTARMLKPAGIDSVVVVTQGWHLPRAIWSFERAGLHAIPAPVRRISGAADSISDFLPSTEALVQTFYALHEIIGLAYYRLRH